MGAGWGRGLGGAPQDRLPLHGRRGPTRPSSLWLGRAAFDAVMHCRLADDDTMDDARRARGDFLEILAPARGPPLPARAAAAPPPFDKINEKKFARITSVYASLRERAN